MQKILIVFGTRPEAIKMAPLVLKFLEKPQVFETRVCVTAQHRQMLDQVLNFFNISPDYDLNLMRADQNLYQLTSDVILGMRGVIEGYKPDYIFVHGDTTTSAFAALAGFYAQAKVCHIEAGLRTHNIYSPFPEEINRQITGRIATWHFAPTIQSKNNLIAENICSENILITGNTVIDSLLFAQSRVENYNDSEIDKLKQLLVANKKVILVTGHRRENFGKGFEEICKAILEIAKRPDIQIVYPVHFNPSVQKVVNKYLQDNSNIVLIEPLAYPAFVWLMKRSNIILTDSGGIQEEAPSLGKPVLVMRDNTERPEAIESGTARLVGTDFNKITNNVHMLLDDPIEYAKFSLNHNPYGDGMACNRIFEFLKNNPKV